MTQLTFKQYLESREQLLKAIENTPIAVLEYNIKKYCSLPVGDNISEKQSISLKPKNTIIVEWCYENVDNPQPQSIRFPDSSDDNEYNTFWTGKKLNTWLLRHASKGVNSKY